MPSYYDIKQKELKTTKDFSEKKFNRYVKAHRILRALYSELFFWSVSLVPLIICAFLIGGSVEVFAFFFFVHFLFWYFKGQRMFYEDCRNDIEELDVTIEVLLDIKKEKYING